jgi:hypothetical protein
MGNMGTSLRNQSRVRKPATHQPLVKLNRKTISGELALMDVEYETIQVPNINEAISDS